MAHDNHMLAYAAAMQGESVKATQAIADLLADLPSDFITAHAAKLDAFFAMPYELHLRFGRWDQMLAEPAPPNDQFPIARAFWHFARGTAREAKKRPAEAQMEQAPFRNALAIIPPAAVFRKNRASAVLDVAD